MNLPLTTAGTTIRAPQPHPALFNPYAHTRPWLDTYSDAARAWFRSIQTTVDPTTASAIQKILTSLLLPVFGDLHPSQIDQATVHAFRRQVLDKHGSIADASIFHCAIRVLVWSLGRTTETDLAPELTTPGPVPVPALCQILRRAPTDFSALLILQCTTGLRNSEVVHLRWRDVSLPQERIHAPSAPRQSADAAAGTRPSRTIHLCECSRAAIRARIHSRGSSPFVFCEPDGKAHHSRQLREKTWKPLLNALGLPAYSMHQLRQTATYLRLAAGEEPSYVAKQLDLPEPPRPVGFDPQAFADVCSFNNTAIHCLTA